jgi:hypothetical protein
MATPELVVTPGGARPRSLVHHVAPEHVLDEGGGRLRMLDAAGAVKLDLDALPRRPGPGPLLSAGLAPGALRGGWIANSAWDNGTGEPITRFTTTWTVPPEPHTRNGQTVFLFNAIQNSTMIYQPVLQWGRSGAGGGDYWAVASWYADGQDGHAFYSSLVRVAPGDVLVGVMTHTGSTSKGHSYECRFAGIAHTALAIRNVEELTSCSETLEAYQITRCSDYPVASGTAMRSIAIHTGKASPAIDWTPVDGRTECGQSVSVVSNSSTDGRVDLHYRLWNPWRSLGSRPTASPAAVSWAPGRLDVFQRGQNGDVLHKWGDGTTWFPSPARWESLGGSITGQPTAVSWAAGRLDLFGRAADGTVCHKWFEGGWGPSATGWEGLGGSVEGVVSAVSWGPNRLDLFARGSDDSLWHSWWDGSGWGAWEWLGGSIAGSPSAVAWGPNRLDVFCRGTDDGVARRSWDGTRWTDWERLGGKVVASPVAVSWAPNRLDVFARGADGTVQHKWSNGGAWGPGQLDWESIGGRPTGGGVSAVSWGPGRLDVFAIGPDRAVYHTWFDGAWGPTDSDWEPLGGRVAGTLTPVAWGPNRLDLFARGATVGVWARAWTGSRWSPG